MLSFSEGVHAQLAAAVEKVQGEGAEGIVLDLRGNPGGLLDEAVLSASLFLPEDEVVVSTKSRTQGDSVHKTVGGNAAEAAAGRPDRPQHRLGGGDPHRGAGRRRRRHRGRHPLLRQGRLPGGEGPRQRRRAEADGRRILHPGRRQPRAQPRHPPRRQGQRRPRNARPTRPSSGRSACSPARSEVEPAAARRSREPGRGAAVAPTRAGDASGQRPRRGRGAAARAARLPRLPRLARGRGGAGRGGGRAQLRSRAAT